MLPLLQIGSAHSCAWALFVFVQLIPQAVRFVPDVVLPIGHTAHNVLPASGWILPAGQVVQAAVPVVLL